MSGIRTSSRQTPLRLAKGLYGLTLCGKYWHIELLDFLIAKGFVQSKVDPCLMIRRDEDGNFTKLINYVDDMCYVPRYLRRFATWLG